MARRERLYAGTDIKKNLMPICLPLLRTITSCSTLSLQQGPGQSLEVSVGTSLGEGERVVWAPTVQWIKGRLGSGVGPELKVRPVLTCCIPIGELTSPGLVFTCVKWG